MAAAADLLTRLCARAADVPRPSVMLVLAHPDDETVGAASLLPALSLARLVYVTDGAPRNGEDARAAGCTTREAYAQVRRGELLSALESVGIAPARAEFAGFVDQEAVQQLYPLTLWLEILLREHAPALVLTHPYEGGHPDHDATAFAVHLACQRIAASGAPAPAVAEFTSYHRGPDGQWEFGTFLSASPAPVIVRKLTAQERAIKHRLLSCYRSQRAVLERLPLDVERFRVAPSYNFTSPPGPGPLLYEERPWGVTGTAWRAHAAAALDRLSVEPRRASVAAVPQTFA